MEQNLDKWHSEKTKKYRNGIVQEGNSEWTFRQLVVEVGARGFVPRSFLAQFRRLGFCRKEVHALREAASRMARRCSYVIWVNRFNRNFEPWRLQ